jgi:TadE-like protein
VAARESAVGRMRGRRRHATGQATVEFALIAVPFFLTFFGIVEFSLIMASIGSFDFAARDGARIGSILGRTDPQVDQDVINAVTARVQSIVMAKVTEIDVYRANPIDGTCFDLNDINSVLIPPPAPGSHPIDDPLCAKNQYAADGTLIGSVGWPVNDRSDTQQIADYVGVRVLYQYTFLTYAVVGAGSTLNLSTYSVQRIEPQNFGRRQVPAPVASRAPMGDLDLAPAAALPRWVRRDMGGGIA